MNPVTVNDFELFKQAKAEIVQLEKGRWTRYKFISLHPIVDEYAILLDLKTKHPVEVWIPDLYNKPYRWVVNPNQDELYKYAAEYHREQMQYYQEQLHKFIEEQMKKAEINWNSDEIKTL